MAKKQKWKWSPGIGGTGDIIGELLLMTSIEEKLNLLTEIAAHAMGCSRVCIILQSPNGKKGSELNLVSGYPKKDGHGFGKVLPDFGKKELEDLITGGTIEFIIDPHKDKRFAYMRDLIRDKDIKAILEVPLFYIRKDGSSDEYEIPPFGLMAFDWTGQDIVRYEKEKGKKFDKSAASGVKKLAKAVVSVILEDRQRNEEINAKLKKFGADIWTKEALGFEDGLRNPFTVIKADIEKLDRTLQKLAEKLPDDEDMRKCQQRLEYLRGGVGSFSERAYEFLLDTKFQPKNLNFVEQDIGSFLKELATEFANKKKEEQSPVSVWLNCKQLNGNGHLKMDQARMRESFYRILENATAAGANTIWIKASVRSMNGNGNHIVITIANDGRLMSASVAKQIFNAFAATNKMQPRALSIVRSVIEAHDGEIQLKEEPRTTFIIRLPVRK